MLELLAADTISIARRTEPERVAPQRSIFALATSAGAAGATLLWLILAGPGFLGYGASLLWAGTPKAGAPKFYDISVQPGNKLVRRKADQMVTAQTRRVRRASGTLVRALQEHIEMGGSSHGAAHWRHGV